MRKKKMWWHSYWIIVILTLLVFVPLVVLLSKDTTYREASSTQTTYVLLDEKEAQNKNQFIEKTGTFEGSFCLVGEPIVRDFLGTKVNTIVMGPSFYKDKTFCKSKSQRTLNSALGPIQVTTEYYFLKDDVEGWIIVTTENNQLFTPQVVESHVLEGKIVS